MTFQETLAHVITWLQREQRVSYRALKRQLSLDDAYLEDLKEELIYAKKLAMDEDGRVLVWTGNTGTTPALPIPSPHPGSQPDAQETTHPETTSAPDTTSAPEAERRQLTVMFCDMVDSTSLASHLDPEALRHIVRAYQATCATVIQRFEGHIAQYLGDGLLVYFGYPQAHEDDALRAIRAGLGILEAMTALQNRLQQNQGIGLSLRLGIHTGLVVIGEIGADSKREQLALGETPNVAARLQALAAPDTLLVSVATYRLLHNSVVCTALGEQPLRGVAQPLAIYRVERLLADQEQPPGPEGNRLTPLVGRTQEVALLRERWEQAQEGLGQVVVLSGEAGIGKSRLVQVLQEQISVQPHITLACHTSPYYQDTALYPLSALVQRVLAWQPHDSPPVRLHKLEALLTQMSQPLTHSVSLLAALLALPVPVEHYAALTLTPQQQRQQTLETLLALVGAWARQQPVLLVMEDLHWVDPSTLEWLTLLLDQVPTSAILLLMTCRPIFQHPWGSRSYVTQFTLNRLPRARSAQMIAQVLGGKSVPEEVLQHLAEKTDGVPLFVEEITKAVLESGILRETETHFELTGTLTTALTIPPTLHDALMARLDRLVSAKGLAQLGATIGREFSYALLQRVSQLDDTTLERELRRLVDAELVYQQGLPPNARYVFKHALIQDAAYQSLLKSTRQHYHRQIAQTLEAHFPEVVATQPELLAHHYTEAGASALALPCWQQAGQQALARLAHAEAIRHLTRGLTLLETLPDPTTRPRWELTLRLTLGPIFLATRGYASQDVEQNYTRALQLSQDVGDVAQHTQALLGLRNFHMFRGELEIARTLGEELLSLASTQGNTALLGQAHHALAHTLYFQGALLPARQHAEQALEFYNPQQHRLLASSSGIGDLQVQYLSTLSWILMRQGYVAQAIARSREAINLARELEHPFSLTIALAYAAWTHLPCRQPQIVQEHAETLMHIATEHGFTYQWARGLFVRGWALAMQGQPGEGTVQMQQGLSAMHATGTALGQTGWLAALAEAYCCAGQLEAAQQALAEAQQTITQSGVQTNAALILRLEGTLILAQTPEDNEGKAAECFLQSLTLARQQHAKLWELQAAIDLGRLWYRQGRRAEAQALLTDSYGWFTEGFDLPDLQEAKGLLAAWVEE